MIPDKMPRGNFVIGENSKAVFDDGFCRLSTITAIPIPYSDPITELCAIEQTIPAQRHSPEQWTAWQTNREDNAEPFVETSLVRRNPGLRDPIFVRIGNTQGRLVNPLIFGERLDLRGVRECKRPLDQSVGADRFL